ncbi:MAG TPA: hypothetical protein PLO33_16560 [Kouleothrix sp.]|uniref:hypothetical protein n=1 Tax=Kouleothrix sp. TaxID=2779161 RepID=UPI002BE08640|nr:hypothetical protein [Kouleothrix sp.]HRC77295.1 hypothetical protein [Kouleothrix sp.]
MRNTNWHGYRMAAWFGQALLAIAIVVVLVQRQWFAAAALAGFLALSFAFVSFERKLPTLFDLIFVIAALINAGGWAWNLYNQPGPYDEIAHLYTIFAITLAAGYLFYSELMESFFKHRILFVLTIASLGIALGALWEVIEWLSDFVLPQQIVSGLTDTITDIMLDSAGAILAALLNLRGLHEQSRADGAGAERAPRRG